MQILSLSGVKAIVATIDQPEISMEWTMSRLKLTLTAFSLLTLTAPMSRADVSSPPPLLAHFVFMTIASDDYSSNNKNPTHLSRIGLDEASSAALLTAARTERDADRAFQHKRLGEVCAKADAIQTIQKLADEFAAYKYDLEANQLRLEQQTLAGLSESARAKVLERLQYHRIHRITPDDDLEAIMKSSDSAPVLLGKICAEIG